MSIMSKRIAVKKINIGSDGKNRGEIDYIFELDPKKLILRDIKTLHTKVNEVYDLSEWTTDMYLSDSVTESSLSSAIAGGLIFGAAGAIVGAIVGQGKPTWIFEMKNDSSLLLFRLRNDSDKKVLEKYVRKHSK